MSKTKIVKPSQVKRSVDASGTIRYRTAHGRLHRDGGPAIEYINGHKEWYQNGLRHRLDGPAIEYINGGKEWYQNGHHHRLDGPAIITFDGSLYWIQKGQYHREDGPARIVGGTRQYYLNGHFLKEEMFFEWMRAKQLAKAVASLEKFSDKFGKGKNLEKAGVAVLKFLQGECEHTFKNKNKKCELCDSL